MLNRWNFLKTGFYEGINVTQERPAFGVHQPIAVPEISTMDDSIAVRKSGVRAACLSLDNTYITAKFWQRIRLAGERIEFFEVHVFSKNGLAKRICPDSICND